LQYSYQIKLYVYQYLPILPPDGGVRIDNLPELIELFDAGGVPLKNLPKLIALDTCEVCNISKLN
jgi:hypothetical protein